MADEDQTHEYWRKKGEDLVAQSGSAGLPPTKKSEYFVAPGRDTAMVGSSEVSMPRPSEDKLSDAQGHLTGSAMSQMMQKNYDAANEYQMRQKYANRYRRPQGQ